MYNIDDWVGGIQSLRTYTIQKKINGQWIQEAPAQPTVQLIWVQVLMVNVKLHVGLREWKTKMTRHRVLISTKFHPMYTLHLYLAVTDLVIQFIGVEAADEICKINYGRQVSTGCVLHYF